MLRDDLFTHKHTVSVIYALLHERLSQSKGTTETKITRHMQWYIMYESEELSFLFSWWQFSYQILIIHVLYMYYRGHIVQRTVTLKVLRYLCMSLSTCIRFIIIINHIMRSMLVDLSMQSYLSLKLATVFLFLFFLVHTRACDQPI